MPCACSNSVAVGMDANVDETSVDDVNQSEDRIVSQWREVSDDKKHELRERVDEILRPLGYETSLLVIRRANSIAFYFICMTLAALMSLRDQFQGELLRSTVQKLFSLLSHAARRVRVKRLTWPMSDYERSLKFFSFVKGKQTTS